MSLSPTSIGTSNAAREPAAGRTRVAQIRSRNGGSIVCATFTNGSVSEQQALADEAYDLLSAMDQPFAVVVDMRRLTDYPARQRQVYAKLRERLRPVYERLHKLTVYVVESDAQRGFVIAVGWKAKASPASGRTFTDDLDRAYALCEQALLEAPTADH